MNKETTGDGLSQDLGIALYLDSYVGNDKNNEMDFYVTLAKDKPPYSTTMEIRCLVIKGKYYLLFRKL